MADAQQSGFLALPAGSIQLQQILITSDISGTSGKATTLDIRPMVAEFSIYESIHSPYLTADILLIDALALSSVFPLVGQETIKFVFKTPDPSVQSTITAIFRIVSIENFTKAKLRIGNYIIHLASEEYFTDMTTKITKSYRQQLISDMVTDVYKTQLKSAKTIKVSPTYGQRTIVIPNMHPQRALKFLSREAKSEQYKASNWVYYESIDGFQFITIDEMIARSQSFIDVYYAAPKNFSTNNTPDLTNITAGGSVQTQKSEELTRITDFSFPTLFTNDMTGIHGGWENTSNWIDPVNSEYSSATYDYFSNFNDLNRTTSGTGKGKMLTPNNKLIDSRQSVNNYFITNHSRNDADVDQKPEFFHVRRGSLGLMNNIMIDVTIPGDTDKRVGQKVDLRLPEFGGTDDVIGKINKFVSGYYLIVAVRHLYNASGYNCVLSCMKNCYEQDVTATLLPTVQQVNPVTSTNLTGPTGQTIV